MADSMITASALTAEQVEAVLIQPLLAQSVVLSAGPRMFMGKGVPILVPKLTSYDIGTPNNASASYWVGENTLIPEADPTFGQVTLLPSSLKSIKVLHRYSNELARHSVIDVANALRDAIVQRVQLALDRAFLIGEGTNNTPLGIINQPGITPMSTGASVTVDNLYDAQTTAMGLNANPNTWFMAPATFGALRKQKDLQGRYYLQPDPTIGGMFRLLGLPVKVSTQIPANRTILADMAQVAVGRDQDVTAQIFNERYMEFDQQAIRVTSRWDIGLLNAQAVIVLQGP